MGESVSAQVAVLLQCSRTATSMAETLKATADIMAGVDCDDTRALTSLYIRRASRLADDLADQLKRFPVLP